MLTHDLAAARADELHRQARVARLGKLAIRGRRRRARRQMQDARVGLALVLIESGLKLLPRELPPEPDQDHQELPFDLAC